jgi:hypothetical protein
MKPFASISTVPEKKFVRNVGLSKENFQQLHVKVIDFMNAEKRHNPLKKRGRKSTLAQEDRLLLTLYYQRHYPTFEVLGNIFDICESYCQKIYTRTVRIIAKVQTLPSNQEQLENTSMVLAIDATEQRIERPVKKQKQFFSGKKSYHSIKAQLLICLSTLKILAIHIGKGKQHDFALFKNSQVFIHPKAKLLVDSGYQGVAKYHKNSVLPYKRKKNQSLTTEEKAHNQALAKQRIAIEHVNRRCKIFRIVKETYRGKHKNYSLNWHVVAALVNLRYGII